MLCLTTPKVDGDKTGLAMLRKQRQNMIEISNLYDYF
jgi:hypothetical protein